MYYYVEYRYFFVHCNSWSWGSSLILLSRTTWTGKFNFPMSSSPPLNHNYIVWPPDGWMIFWLHKTLTTSKFFRFYLADVLEGRFPVLIRFKIDNMIARPNVPSFLNQPLLNSPYCWGSEIKTIWKDVRSTVLGCFRSTLDGSNNGPHWTRTRWLFSNFGFH